VYNRICFLISPIGDENTPTRKRADFIKNKIIKPAAERYGYKLVRADDISDPGKITSQIMQHLLEDSLVIADLTGLNPNVFYELAVRHILKKPFIQISEQPIPFDVSDLRTIFFNHKKLTSVKECKKNIISQMNAININADGICYPYLTEVFPDMHFYKTESEIDRHMLKLISSGSTLDIVSERLHWIKNNPEIESRIIGRVESGVDINIYIPKHNQTSVRLNKKGVKVHVCSELMGPHARFTLIDKNRPGGATLAVGSGTIPKFMISEYKEKFSAQVVAMARDYLTNLKH